MEQIFSFERDDFIKIHLGDCRTLLKTFPSERYDTCVTSPPYFNQRDYGMPEQLGLEATPEEYIDGLVGVFREVHRVLRDDGTLWLNLGDGYANSSFPSMSIKPRDLLGLPWRLALKLQEDGWYLRQDIVWDKPDCLPEPVKNRCVKSHEYLFLLSKRPTYYFDWEAIREIGVSGKKSTAAQRDTRETHGSQSNGNRGINAAKIKMQQEFEEKGYVTRNKRSVWRISVQQGGVRNEHFATFPPDLVRPCIKAGSREGSWVLDPFAGSGTTGMMARELGRRADLIELNPEYYQLSKNRCGQSNA